MGAASHFVCGLYDARISKAELQERRDSQVTIGCNVKVSTSLLEPCSNIAFAFFNRHLAVITNLPLIPGMAQFDSTYSRDGIVHLEWASYSRDGTVRLKLASFSRSDYYLVS
jgi:hypothetical protein